MHRVIKQSKVTNQRWSSPNYEKLWPIALNKERTKILWKHANSSKQTLQTTTKIRPGKNLLTTIAPILCNIVYDVPDRATCRENFSNMSVTRCDFSRKYWGIVETWPGRRYQGSCGKTWQVVLRWLRLVLGETPWEREDKQAWNPQL